MKKMLLTLAIGSALVLGACGGKDNSKPANEGKEPAKTTETAKSDPEKITKAKCTSCHGQNLEGQGSFPALNNVGSRLSKEEILGVIQKGKGAMPPNLISGADAEAVAEWLAAKK